MLSTAGGQGAAGTFLDGNESGPNRDFDAYIAAHISYLVANQCGDTRLVRNPTSN